MLSEGMLRQPWPIDSKACVIAAWRDRLDTWQADHVKHDAASSIEYDFDTRRSDDGNGSHHLESGDLGASSETPALIENWRGLAA